MLEALFQIESCNEVIHFGVFNGFVYVKDLDFVGVVTVNGFQTGNISKERRSGKAPEINNRVLTP